MFSFDIRGAFDNADWGCIKSRLRSLGVEDYLQKVFESYLTNRVVHSDPKTSSHFDQKGCPQGSCLGPVFWIILADVILRAFDQEPECSVLAYADDFTLTISTDTRRPLERLGTRLINKFNDTCTNLGLSLSKEKTLSLIMGKDMTSRFPTFIMDGHNIRCVNVYKVLGLTINRELNFSPHVENLQSEALRLAFNVDRVSGKHWGVSADIIKTWYLAMVQPKLLYCAEVWYPFLNVQGVRRLLSAQCNFLRKAIKCYRTTSKVAILTLTTLTKVSNEGSDCPPFIAFKETLQRKSRSQRYG